MAVKKTERPILDKDVKALVASAIASISKVYGITTAQAADRIKREADRVGWDIANAAVLAEMRGTGLGAKPANDAATKPSVAKAAPKAAPKATPKPAPAAPAAPVKAVSAASVRRRKAR